MRAMKRTSNHRKVHMGLLDFLKRPKYECGKRVLATCPRDAMSDPIALDDLVRLNGQVYSVVAMSHRGKVAVRAVGNSRGTGARWVPGRYVVRVRTRRPLYGE